MVDDLRLVAQRELKLEEIFDSSEAGGLQPSALSCASLWRWVFSEHGASPEAECRAEHCTTFYIATALPPPARGRPEAFRVDHARRALQQVGGPPTEKSGFVCSTLKECP
ncbi:hypothetical protein KRMM14A1259_19040 [Krasilnikovia sp. MM14-A1259]